MGGGSRVDIRSLLFLQPFAVFCAAVCLIGPGRLRLDRVRAPLLFLAALAIVIAVQLVPLPPSVWSSLPGHALYASALAREGIAPEWRPLTMTPDLTLASLVGLIVPAAVVTAYASVSEERARHALPVILGFIVLGVLLALLQLAGGEHSPFYTYEITNRGSPVGWLANRNHQAMLLTMAMPMLAIWAGQAPTAQGRRVRLGFAAVTAIVILVLIGITGSRAGLLLMPVGLFFGWLQLRADSAKLRKGREPVGPALRLILKVAPIVLGLAVIGAGLVLARTESFERLLSQDVAEDQRAQAFPIVARMTRDFFPVGSGFGSFDPLYRAYETPDALRTSYLNHAHDDLLELAMTGGLPALVLLAAFLVWYARCSWRIMTAPASATAGASFARLAVAMTLILLLAAWWTIPCERR